VVKRTQLALFILIFITTACSTTPSKNQQSRDPKSFSFKQLCETFLLGSTNRNAGEPFDSKAPIGKVQVGVDPQSLIPNKDLNSLDSERLRNVEEHARDIPIEVNHLGFVIQGHHRLKNALKNNRSIDVKIVSLEPLLEAPYVVKEPLVIKKSQMLSAYELSFLRQEFARKQIPYVSALGNRNHNLTLSIFSQLHPLTQESLLKLLDYYREKKIKSSEIEDKLLKLTGITFRKTFLQVLIEKRLTSTQIRLDLEKYRQMDSEEQLEFAKQARAFIQSEIASNAWNSYYFTKLPLTPVKGSKFSVKIKDQVLYGTKKGKNIFLQVPTSMIRHASWNPLTNLTGAAQNSFGPPRSYPADLALTGVFYLFDGNHRYALYDAKKESVTLRLAFRSDEDGSAYIKSSGVRHLLDAIGQRQPSHDELKELQNGKITPESLVHENFRPLLMPITELPQDD